MKREKINAEGQTPMPSLNGHDGEDDDRESVEIVNGLRVVKPHMRCPVCYENPEINGVLFVQRTVRQRQYRKCDKCGYNRSNDIHYQYVGCEHIKPPPIRFRR